MDDPKVTSVATNATERPRLLPSRRPRSRLLKDPNSRRSRSPLGGPTCHLTSMSRAALASVRSLPPRPPLAWTLPPASPHLDSRRGGTPSSARPGPARPDLLPLRTKASPEAQLVGGGLHREGAPAAIGRDAIGLCRPLKPVGGASTAVGLGRGL